MLEIIKSKLFNTASQEESTRLLSDQQSKDEGDHDKYKLVYWVKKSTKSKLGISLTAFFYIC